MRYRWSRKPPPCFISSIFSTPDFIASPESIRPEGVTTVRTLRELLVARSLSTRSRRVTVPTCDQKRTSRTDTHVVDISAARRRLRL